MRPIESYSRMRDAVRDLGVEGFVSAVLDAARSACCGHDRDLERRRHSPAPRRSVVVEERLELRPAP